MSPNERAAQHECCPSGEYVHDGGGSIIIGEKNLRSLGELGQRTECSTCQMVSQLLANAFLSFTNFGYEIPGCSFRI